MEVQVMETRRRVLGEEHPSALISMSNLAFLIKEQGRTMEAIKKIGGVCPITQRGPGY